MNQIASFRLCTLSDSELLQKVDEATDSLYTTGKIPMRHIPARPDEDYDLLVGELISRYKERMDAAQRPTVAPVAEELEYYKTRAKHFEDEFDILNKEVVHKLLYAERLTKKNKELEYQIASLQAENQTLQAEIERIKGR